MTQRRSLLLFTAILCGSILALFGTYWDDAWHTDFGRDDFFIPPHLTLCGGVTLAGVAVMEYESDVPQFASLWYLPVLTMGTTLAFASVRINARFPWMASAAAALYTLLRLGIAGVLAALGHSFAFVPVPRRAMPGPSTGRPERKAAAARCRMV